MRLKVLEKRGKRLILALLRPLLGGRPLSPQALADRPPQRVLVVRQDERLGNVILITPFLEVLRKLLPRAHLAVLVSSRFAEVLHGNPHVDRILSFDKREFLYNPLRFIAFLRALRGEAFDLAIDCGPVDGLSLNNSLLTFLAGAPLRLGHLRGESHLFLNLQIPRSDPKRSEIDYHLDLLRCCFGQVPRGRIRVCLASEERQKAARAWRAWGLAPGDLVVGLHVGGRGHKRWPEGRFARLARSLVRDQHVKVILFWGPDERNLIGEFERNPLKGLFIAPSLRIRELAAQIERCTVFISGDTGPMHLALAVGTPTVAIFRVPNFTRYGRQGPHNRIVYCPAGDVPVGDVLAAFRDLRRALQRRSDTIEASDHRGFPPQGGRSSDVGF